MSKKKPTKISSEELLNAESIFAEAKKLLDQKINTISGILERMQDGFFAMDKRWRITYFNKEAERLTGKNREEVLGKNFWKLFPTAADTIAHPMYQHAMTTGESVNFEMFSKLFNAWYVIHAYPSDSGLSIFFKNVTQRKKQEEQIKLMNHRYELAAKATSDALWDWDILTDTGYLSQRYADVYGIPSEQEQVLKVWQERIHIDDRDKVVLSLFAALNNPSKDQWQEEYRFYRADNSLAHVLDRAFIVRDDKGKAIRMVGSKRDVTREYEVDRELRRLSKVVTETSAAVVITDPQERITWVNKAFVDITGYSQEEVLGRKPAPLLQGPGTDPQTKKYLRQKIDGLEPFKCEILNYHKNGSEYWLEMKGEPIKDSLGNVESFFSIQSDISERIAMQNKLMAQQLEMQQKISKAIIETQEHERTEMGKELHDNVCQIIATTKLYLENIQHFPEQARDFTNKGIDLCTLALNEIRGIAHQLVAPNTDHQNLRLLIDDMLNHYRVFKQFTVDFSYDLKDMQQPSDISLTIYRIVQEQMNNIVKYARATKVTVSLSCKEDQLYLVMKDDGVGFDVSKKATGLGLNNIRNRAGLYNGKMVLHSQPGKGTTLTISFPNLGCSTTSIHAA